MFDETVRRFPATTWSEYSQARMRELSSRQTTS